MSTNKSNLKDVPTAPLSPDARDKEIEKLKKDRDEANTALERSQVLIDNLNRLIDQIIDRVRDQCETIDLSTANIVSIRRELQVMKSQSSEKIKAYLSAVESEGSANASRNKNS